MAVSKRLRFEILRRDNHACRYCGRSAPEVRLTVDHVLPTTLGGNDLADNLVASCADCNNGKSAATPDAALVADVSEDAVRWARARNAAAEQMLADLERRDELRADFESRWNDWGVGQGQFRKTVPLPGDWQVSVDSILAAGLPLGVLLECVDLAMQQSTRRTGPTDANIFRYMCGIAWNRVRELDSRAQALVVEEEDFSGATREQVVEAFLTMSEMHRACDRAIEAFLQTLPVWVHEQAERAAEHDWACAGEPDAMRERKVPDVLRHVGSVLSGCEIRPPAPTEVD